MLVFVTLHSVCTAEHYRRLRTLLAHCKYKTSYPHKQAYSLKYNGTHKPFVPVWNYDSYVWKTILIFLIYVLWKTNNSLPDVHHLCSFPSTCSIISCFRLPLVGGLGGKSVQYNRLGNHATPPDLSHWASFFAVGFTIQSLSVHRFHTTRLIGQMPRRAFVCLALGHRRWPRAD